MTFITKRALPRRTFLRGMGATVALPMLDAMAPALSAATAAPPRLGFVYVSNGVIQEQWNPAATGKGFEFTPILKPLEPLREHLNILSGLAHLQADTFGDGTGDHPRASAVWLSGVHAWDRTRPGVEVKLAVTASGLRPIRKPSAIKPSKAAVLAMVKMFCTMAPVRMPRALIAVRTAITAIATSCWVVRPIRPEPTR